LHGGGPDDFREHALTVASQLLVLGEKAADEAAAREMAESAVWAGKAWEMFRKLVTAQGGDVSYIDDPQKLPAAKLVEAVKAPSDGYLAEINARVIGESAVALGAGRAEKGQPIDHAVGFEILKRVGDQVQEGDDLFVIHANRQDLLEEARSELLKAHIIQSDAVEALPLIYGVVS
jgi:pyrimidine-nucleoside phosphorylase